MTLVILVMKQNDEVTGIHWRDKDAKLWVKDFWGKARDLCNKIKEAWLAAQNFHNRANESVCKNKDTTEKYKEMTDKLEDLKKTVEEDVKKLYLTSKEWHGKRPWLELWAEES